VLTVIVKITEISIAMLTVIVTITGDLYVVKTVILTITGRSICNVNSYCENNGNIYMQC
jgi:hypothetical protein